MECPVCKSNNTVESKLTTGLSFVVVTSIDTKVPTKKNSSIVRVKTCLDCGNIFDFKALSPKILNEKK